MKFSLLLAIAIMLAVARPGSAFDVIQNGDFEQAGAIGSQSYGPGWAGNNGFSVAGPGVFPDLNPYSGSKMVACVAQYVRRSGMVRQSATVKAPGTYTVSAASSFWQYTEFIGPFGVFSGVSMTLKVDDEVVSFRTWRGFFDVTMKEWHQGLLQWTGHVNSTVEVQVFGQSDGAAGGWGVTAFDGVSLDVSPPISRGINYVVNGDFESSGSVGNSFIGFMWPSSNFSIITTPWWAMVMVPGGAHGGNKAVAVSASYANAPIRTGTLEQTVAIPPGLHNLWLQVWLWQYDIYGYRPGIANTDIEFLVDGFTTGVDQLWADEHTGNNTWYSYTKSRYGSVSSNAKIKITARAQADARVDDYSGIIIDDVLLQEVDTTPPVTPVVTDDGWSTGSTTELHCKWTAIDAESGIMESQYCIGTSPGASNVVNWMSLGQGTEVTKTGLSLAVGTAYYFTVKSQNNQRLWSAPASSDGIIVTTPTTVTSIGQLKGMVNGSIVKIDNHGVSALEGSSFWLQNASRTSGIKVDTLDYVMPYLNNKVSVIGTLDTVNGERVIRNASHKPVFGIVDIKPVKIAQRDLGGEALNGVTPGLAGSVGLNNNGLLVIIWGRVTKLANDYYYVDDGAALVDGTSTSGIPNVGVRVLHAPSGLTMNDIVLITGISRYYQTGSGLAKALTPQGVVKL